MSAHMKTHPTNHSRSNKKDTGIPWREVAKDLIEEYTEIGLMIRGGRCKAGLTQKQLAEKLEIHTHHISEMEHGKRPVSKKMARKLGKIFNVDYRIFL